MLQILRTFRLSRIFRVLKVSQRMGRASLIAEALTASSDVIFMLAFLLLLSMLIFSALVYETERSVYRTWDPATGETACLLPRCPSCCGDFAAGCHATCSRAMQFRQFQTC